MIEQGSSNCGSFVGNPATVRETDPIGADDLALFAAAGICPVGRAIRILDEYINLAKRTLEGQDITVNYDFESEFGEFGLRYSASFTDTFDQVPTGAFTTIQEAQDSGALPGYVNLTGFGNLLGIDGAYDEKHTLKLLWSKGSWGGSVSALKKGDFIDAGLTLADGTEYVVPSMTTIDASLCYKFKLAGTSARIKFAVKNLEDERAPLADGYFGYFGDAHQDLGRNYYIDFKVSM